MKSRQSWVSLLAIVLLAILLTGCKSTGSEAATATPTSSIEFTASQTTTTPVKPTATPTHAKPTPTPVPPTPTPKPVQRAQPTQPPVPTPTPNTGVNGNPWGYDFDASGSVITSPAAGFCEYFTCVSTFWTKTNGYVVECGDGHYSHSGGVSGACSRNGGVAQILYSH